MSSHRTVGPGVPPSVTWSTRLVMSAQPATGECCHRYNATGRAIDGVFVRILVDKVTCKRSPFVKWLNPSGTEHLNVSGLGEAFLRQAWRYFFVRILHPVQAMSISGQQYIHVCMLNKMCYVRRCEW